MKQDTLEAYLQAVALERNMKQDLTFGLTPAHQEICVERESIGLEPPKNIYIFRNIILVMTIKESQAKFSKMKTNLSYVSIFAFNVNLNNCVHY